MQYNIIYIHVYTHIHTAGASDESERVLFVKNVVGKTFVVRNAVDVNSTKNSGVFPLCTYIHTYLHSCIISYIFTIFVQSYTYCMHTANIHGGSLNTPTAYIHSYITCCAYCSYLYYVTTYIHTAHTVGRFRLFTPANSCCISAM